MAKNQRPKKSTPTAAKVDLSIPSDTVGIWQKPWLPIALLALLSIVYFAEFIVSDKVVFGSDIGTDFHQGANDSLAQKLGDFVHPSWDPKLGGFPSSEELRHQYFPTQFIYLFTSFSASYSSYSKKNS